MTTKLPRLAFLQALSGSAVGTVLPVHAAEASHAQIASAWQALQRDPWLFDVFDDGCIEAPDNAEPQVNSDVYDIAPVSMDTVDRLVEEGIGVPNFLTGSRSACRDTEA